MTDKNTERREILLQTGTNEVEIMEFVCAGENYGINTLKIREVGQYEPQNVTELPGSAPGILGTVEFHGKSVPLVDLGKYLKLPQDGKEKVRRVILFTEFNKYLIGFLVDEVRDIHRISWENFNPPKGLISGSGVIGIALVSDRKIMIIDFEKLADHLLGEKIESREVMPLSSEETDLHERRAQIRIIAADDTPIIRKKLRHTLEAAGYRNLEVFENGGEAFGRIQKSKGTSSFDLLITDIEMPQLDGLTLCKRVKSETPRIPVIVLSSVVNAQMLEKCKTVGADRALSKSDFDQLVSLVDELALKI